MDTTKLWCGDWGDFAIPDDVPVAFRKDGWFDNRRKITPSLKQYFKAMDNHLRDSLPILSWADWQKEKQ